MSEQDRKGTMPEQEPENISADPMEVVVLAEEGLNLRARPTYDAHVVDVLQKGAELHVLPLLEESADWMPVWTGEDLGWVRREFVQTLQP